MELKRRARGMSNGGAAVPLLCFFLTKPPMTNWVQFFLLTGKLLACTENCEEWDRWLEHQGEREGLVDPTQFPSCSDLLLFALWQGRSSAGGNSPGFSGSSCLAVSGPGREHRVLCPELGSCCMSRVKLKRLFVTFPRQGGALQS